MSFLEVKANPKQNAKFMHKLKGQWELRNIMIQLRNMHWTKSYTYIALLFKA